MNNSDMPAMPLSGEARRDLLDEYCHGSSEMIGKGLTKREHFAGLALQGLLTGMGKMQYAPREYAESAVIIADAILKELEN